MKPLKLLLLAILITCKSYGQNYIEYHCTFNRIDEDVLSRNYYMAIERLDSIYTNFEFIYAKHCLKALQICTTANDSLNAGKWLAKCFKQGLPIWIIRNNGLSNLSLSYSTTQYTLHNYDSLHSMYSRSVDSRLAAIIDSLLIIDQKYTRRVNDGFILFRHSVYWLQWGINNKRQYRVLKQIIETHGYPEEKLMGLSSIEDSNSFAKWINFWGPSELRDAKMQIMLQHCFSTWHKVDPDFKQTLYRNLCNGNLPPFQFAIISDFMYSGKKKYNRDKYRFTSERSDKDYVDHINANRHSIGLNSIEEDRRNTLLERERRKNNKANAEIMLE